jgi:Holliday junction DNA helicase RuvA
MIAHLKGSVFSQTEDSIVLDVAGVGYEIHLSTQTLEKIATLPSPLSLIIYTVVREDSITLFGFLSQREKTLFLRLISVSGIGPKLAMNILSGIHSEDLIAAIHREDLVRLTAIPGVGKKTAERMIVELKDKLLNLLGNDAAPRIKIKQTPLTEDVLSALLNLGYNRNEIEKTFERIKIGEKKNFEEALKESLQALAKA